MSLGGTIEEAKRPGSTDAAALRDGLDAIASGLAVWDSEGCLVDCNRAFRLLYHEAEGAFRPGLTFADFAKLVAEAGDPGGEVAPDAWADGLVADFGRETTREQPLADGRTLEIALSATASGGAVTLVNDVTTLKRGERTLRRARDLAEQANHTKSRFLRAANHDLRQPLATLKILIYSCMNEQSEAHRQDLLHAMDISVDIMEDLLGALLQIGQLDAGKIVPRITTFQISQLFERLSVQFGHVAKEKGLSLRILSPSTPVTTDKALLERILSNFVGNAIRYTEVGGILVGCRRRGSDLRIEVWDTGKGIAPEHIGRVFEEFYQVDDVKRKKRGLGLGLNIAQRLAELLDHEVEVRSRPGRGTVFSIAVPVGDVWQSNLGEPDITEMIGGEFAGVPVLLIEDDEVLREAMKELLERWGIVVHAVNGEEQAERLLEDASFAPQLVIADYSLRGKHGTDIVRKLSKAIGRPLPCIIVTADTDPKLIAGIKKEGFLVLIKPVSPPRLRVLMHGLLYEPEACLQNQD